MIERTQCRFHNLCVLIPLVDLRGKRKIRGTHPWRFVILRILFPKSNTLIIK